MSTDQSNDDMHAKPGIFAKVLRLFKGSDKNVSDNERKIHLEPKYWPEVKQFMDSLDDIIGSHTIEDDNIKRINQRVVDYIEEQINKKGQVEDIHARYSGLNTLADRILSNNLNKLVGLKESTHSSAEFSDAVKAFKVKLNEKKQAELDQNKT